MSDMKPQVRAAKRGFCVRVNSQISAKWHASRVPKASRSTCTASSLVVWTHAAKKICKHANTVAESAKHIGHGPLPTEAEGSTCEKPKKLTRSALRQKDYLCGKRWAPLAQALLRRCRAKLRCDVWTEGMRAKLALRNKMCDLVRRAWAQRTKSIILLSCVRAREFSL